MILAVPDPTALYDELADPYIPVKGWKTVPDPDDVKSAAQVITQAKSPLIYAGEGIVYGQASAELVEFAELTNAPVVSTLKGKGVFPESHPLFVGVRGDHVTKYLTDSDVIFAVGSSLSPGRFSHGIPNAVGKNSGHLQNIFHS